jgi:hypothetical protein
MSNPLLPPSAALDRTAAVVYHRSPAKKFTMTVTFFREALKEEAL